LLYFFLRSANFTNCFLNSCYSAFFNYLDIFFWFVLIILWFFYVLFLAESSKLSIFSHDICFDFRLNHEQNKKNLIFFSKKILRTRSLVNQLQSVMLKLWLSSFNAPQFTKNPRWLVRIVLYYFLLYFKVYRT